MQFQDLLTLIDKLDKSSVAYLEYQADHSHVVLSKTAKHDSITHVETGKSSSTEPIEGTQMAHVTQTDAVTVDESTSVEKSGELVPSPMVGVVYLQANPDAEPYVTVGKTVEKGDVICIIEAMKLMNEITAPQSGIIEEILVENESVVEFGQAIVRIK
ncbi:acetyl-CoA carboxylase biotin carboxyl carrier protein [Fundicoccus culcitae]|uniref:Biotin carboxyl carrier protein of acetyl-CoA carboxylase n=1 Tax=Fundicoccus culcitae TaxID=2969821 RepID=A0ABY5P695_9LACT|nr:acetyl-CoA carboxylase biotin carboxyl carrier protein [Fundicoccus culcitae]UUX34268.1 acetyl-CoA carboxylase biotin carboxyl carrier protein [Fundicoccus culcitae]